MRGVDAPLERSLAEPLLDVFQLGVRPARVVADDVEAQDAEHLERGDAARRQLKQSLDQIADGRFADPLEAGGTELKGRFTSAQHAGEQGSVDFRGRRKNQDIALAEARHRRIGECGEDLIADHLGFAPGTMAAVERERGVRGAEGNRRGVEGVDASMDTT